MNYELYCTYYYKNTSGKVHLRKLAKKWKTSDSLSSIIYYLKNQILSFSLYKETLLFNKHFKWCLNCRSSCQISRFKFPIPGIHFRTIIIVSSFPSPMLCMNKCFLYDRFSGFTLGYLKVTVSVLKSLCKSTLHIIFLALNDQSNKKSYSNCGLCV